jgi:membrane-associated phospholipid phosphatase
VYKRQIPHRRGRLTALLTVLVLAGLLGPGPARAGDRYELDGGREALLVGTGLLAGAGGYHLARNQTPLSAAEVAACERGQINGLDRFATRRWSDTADTASDVLAIALMISPAALYTQTGAGMDAGELSTMWVESLLLQQATVAFLKGVFCRPRPYVFNDDPRIPDGLRQSSSAVRSFPSGHTASAFAGAVFLGEVFARLNPDDPARHWVRGGSLALAATTGWLRIVAGRHFLTDVLGGAVLGSLIGWAVPRFHETDGDPVGGTGKARPAPGLTLAFRF